MFKSRHAVATGRHDRHDRHDHCPRRQPVPISWSVQDKKELSHYAPHSDVSAAAASMTARAVGESLIVRDLTTDTDWYVNLRAAADHVTIAGDASKVFATSGCQLTVIDAHSHQTTATSSLDTEHVYDIGVSADGSTLTLLGDYGVVEVINTATLQPVRSWSQDDLNKIQVTSMAVAADGRTIFLGLADGTVEAFDRDTGSELQK